MKYDKELYVGSGIYGGDEEIENYKEKVVKCRKAYICPSCQATINIGDFAVSESGFLDRQPVSGHTCLPCIEEWLEESGQVEFDDEEV